MPAEEKPIGMVLLPGCRCRCGHEWLPRGDEKPRVCPNCHSHVTHGKDAEEYNTLIAHNVKSAETKLESEA